MHVKTLFFWARMSCPFLPPPAQNGTSVGQYCNTKTKHIILRAQFGTCSSTEVEGRSRCTTDLLPLMARMAERSSEKEILQRNKESVMV